MPASLTLAGIVSVGGSAARAPAGSASDATASATTPSRVRSLPEQVMQSPFRRREGSRRRGRQREGQGLAVGAGAQRVRGLDQLLETDRHRIVGGRRGPGGLAE